MRRTIPGVALRTSFIVGFPGETDADFRELCDFVRAAKFDWMGVFGYSDVETAASHALDARDKVDPGVIAERRECLMTIQKKISARNLRRFVGQRVTALVEGPSKENDLVWDARLETMAPEIDGKLLLTDIETPQPAARVPATSSRPRSKLRTITIWPAAPWKLSMRARKRRTKRCPPPFPRCALARARRCAFWREFIPCGTAAPSAVSRPIPKRTRTSLFAASAAASLTSATGPRKNTESPRRCSTNQKLKNCLPTIPKKTATTMSSSVPSVAASSPKRKPRISLAIATAFGLGYIPKAPGTFGSLAGRCACTELARATTHT
jgi:hypothetical protein